jgi:hypothetical protein
MSEIVDASAGDAKGVSRRTRRRPGGSGGGRGRGPRAPRAEGEEGPEPRVKKERPDSTPVPAEFIGQTKEGVVSAIIRKNRVKFGFIHLCPGPEIDEAAPRIYFSFNDLTDSTTTIRRGYVVTLKCSQDDQERAFATEITLTEEGLKIAEEREAEIERKKSEQAAEEGEGRPKKAPRERKPVEEKPVSLAVSCEGFAEVKTIQFNAAQSVGKLKNIGMTYAHTYIYAHTHTHILIHIHAHTHIYIYIYKHTHIATTAFEAPVEFNVYRSSAEDQKAEFLTKAVLLTLVDGDAIHLAAPVEVKEEA